MTSDFIQMPDVAELKEELAAAREDLQEAIKENPDMASQNKFLMEVLGSIEAKLAKEKDLNKLNRDEQISIIAHLNLFYSLLDDAFGDDFDDEEFDFEVEESDFEDDEK